MLRIVLDGAVIENKEMLHSAFAKGLLFPEWYGRNLDALHDCLTDVTEKCDILIVNSEKLKDNLGEYYNGLMCVLKDAVDANGRLSVYKALFEE